MGIPPLFLFLLDGDLPLVGGVPRRRGHVGMCRFGLRTHSKLFVLKVFRGEREKSESLRARTKKGLRIAAPEGGPVGSELLLDQSGDAIRFRAKPLTLGTLPAILRIGDDRTQLGLIVA